MAEALKNLIHAGTVAQLRRHLARVEPRFDGAGFEARALAGLDALAFKARALHLCVALEASLPGEFAVAAAAIEASLAPVRGDEALAELYASEHGVTGWAVWPLTEFVARNGLETPQRALPVLHALTQRFSAEFAIRPFIAAHPEVVLPTLQRWTADPSAHVRRLVSEGSRPRLPWGLQIRSLIADPSPTLPLLRALQDDGSEYVRRSVANHLNDIAKDHPAVVASWLETHLPDAPTERRALLRHASRTLVKKGDTRVLKAWGLGQSFKGEAAFSLAPKRARVGGAISLSLELASTSSKPQLLAIDYVVHHVKANGTTSPKVFKGWQLTLAPRETRVLAKTHSLRPITTRVYYPGEHRVEIQANGRTIAAAAFRLGV